MVLQPAARLLHILVEAARPKGCRDIDGKVAVRDPVEHLLLEMLHVADVARAASVSKHWCCVATSEFLWSVLLQRDFQERCSQNYKRYRELSSRLYPCSWDNYDVFLRFVIIGEARAGKSMFAAQLADVANGLVFHDCSVVTVDHSGLAVRLQLWHMYGEVGFRDVSPVCYDFADALVLLYDQTSRSSFQSLQQWQQEVWPEDRPGSKGVHLVLCANKQDLSSCAVGEEEGRTLAEKLRADWVPTSGLVGNGVERAIALTVDRCLEDRVRQDAELKSTSKRRLARLHAPRCGVQ